MGKTVKTKTKAKARSKAASKKVVKLKANEIDRYTDYKKFRAETTIKIVQ